MIPSLHEQITRRPARRHNGRTDTTNIHFDRIHYLSIHVAFDSMCVPFLQLPGFRWRRRSQTRNLSIIIMIDHYYGQFINHYYSWTCPASSFDFFHSAPLLIPLSWRDRCWCLSRWIDFGNDGRTKIFVCVVKIVVIWHWALQITGSFNCMGDSCHLSCSLLCACMIPKQVLGKSTD